MEISHAEAQAQPVHEYSETNKYVFASFYC